MVRIGKEGGDGTGWRGAWRVSKGRCVRAGLDCVRTLSLCFKRYRFGFESQRAWGQVRGMCMHARYAWWVGWPPCMQGTSYAAHVFSPRVDPTRACAHLGWGGTERVVCEGEGIGGMEVVRACVLTGGGWRSPEGRCVGKGAECGWGLGR